MAEVRPSSSGVFQPPQQHHERSGSMSLGSTAPPPAPASDRASTHTANGNPNANGSSNGAKPQEPAPSAANPETEKQVQDVLASELAVPALLHRLKGSINSAKEFAFFLRKRSTLEEEHAYGLRKLCRMTQDTMHRPEHRDGSFLVAYGDMMSIHERMADNGLQFAQSLQQMHNDLLELCEVAERNRKGWKAQGMAAEQRVQEIEQAMRKSKAKYDALADEYDRARTGDTRQSGKMSFLKMPKSAAQHEEDLLRKVQGADQVYHGQVQTLQSERQQLITTTRPEATKAIQELIRETDAGLSLQLQKFAAYNEKLLLSNGLTISPLKNPNAEGKPQQRSLREAVAAVSNDKDLTDFIAAHHGRIAPNNGEIKYERNPVLNNPPPMQQSIGGPQIGQPAPQGPMAQMAGSMQQFPVQPMNPGQMPPPARTASWGQQSLGSPPAGPPGERQQYSYGPGPGTPSAPALSDPEGPRPSSQHSRSFSHNVTPTQQQAASLPQSQFAARNSAGPAPRFNNPPQGAPQLGALSFQSGDQQQSHPPSHQAPPQQFHAMPPPGQERRGSGANNPLNPLQQSPPSQLQPQAGLYNRTSPPLASHPPPAKMPGKMFHLPLAALYERDNMPVPLVVSQCIQAVELFGLGMEGVYRQSGSMNHINNLKAMFDKDPYNPSLDFRNPENFFQDINSVAGLLKQFFRDLPDPLLTKSKYNDFIAAAKKEDDTQRRDGLHAVINSLDDPNYATLRVLALHLFRVSENRMQTRMDSHNLAVVFGPTLMGTDTNIADSGWQIKVVETILINTHQIFDED